MNTVLGGGGLGEDSTVADILSALRDRHGALVLSGLLTLGQDDEESSRREEILGERTAELELVIDMIESGAWKKSSSAESTAEDAA